MRYDVCVLVRAEGLESTFFLPPADDTTVTARPYGNHHHHHHHHVYLNADNGADKWPRNRQK